MITGVEWLNYHHLLYFWMVAREGSIAQASKQLLLAQPTITGQIRALENTLGEKLFSRSGRNLVLTEVGRLVYRYANEIFSLGRELTDVLKGRPAGRPVRLLVGVSDVLPKLIAHRLLQPAHTLPEPVQIVCHEDHPELLLADLASFGLDLVLTDALVVSQRCMNLSERQVLGLCGNLFRCKAQIVPFGDTPNRYPVQAMQGRPSRISGDLSMSVPMSTTPCIRTPDPFSSIDPTDARFRTRRVRHPLPYSSHLGAVTSGWSSVSPLACQPLRSTSTKIGFV